MRRAVLANSSDSEVNLIRPSEILTSPSKHTAGSLWQLQFMMQYLDFSHASTSRKWMHKRQQGEGFDAPRNSMEFTLEAPQSYGVFQQDVPYSCNMRQYPIAGSLNHGTSAPIKKLIHEGISFRPNEGHKRAPSVIARLMGMDSPPMNTATELTTHSDEKRQEIITRPLPGSDPAETISTKHVSFVQHKISVKHGTKKEIRGYDDDDDEREILGQLTKKSSGCNEWISKPQPREHPQEEELQKFKKDFEAWQATRVWEHSRTLEPESHVVVDADNDRCSEIVPYRYQQQHKGRDHASKHVNSIDDVHWRRRRRSKEGGASISGSRTFSLTSADDGGSTRLPLSRFYHEEEEERPLSPTRIVILKPCPELSADDVEESSLGSPELTKKESNMEAFLEEVKMRLKFELEGSMASGDRAAADRWAAGGHVPAVDPKRIARSIANQIRETVTKDFHPALRRSESTRSYRSGDVQSQMDYICRDARKQLADRLRNVLRREPEAELPPSHRRRASSTTASLFDEEPPRPKPPRRDMARKGSKITSKEEKKRAIESSDARSFRHGYNKKSAAPAADSDDGTASPRNLMRSFSAPVSGSTPTFVKLLSEEPRVLTGARLQRKHEGHGSGSRPPPASSEERQKGRKDAFGIKGRVSNLRQNLGLRGKLFGKKLHSAAAAADDDEPSSSSFLDDLPPIGTLIAAPSVLIHPGVLQENSTEVPPSPASWCSSPPDEMMIRGGYPSPVSPLEASFGEHRSPLKPTASSTASELGNPSSEQAQTEELAETSPVLREQDDDEDSAEMDDPMKSFIRAVLVVAGMYGPIKNSDHFFSSCQPKPIPRWVLDEVASSSSPPVASYGRDDADHRLLFDLVNEALPSAAHGSTALCTFSRWYAAPRSASPSGKRLLDGLWRAVQTRLEQPGFDAPPSSSVDGLIGRDLSASPWTGVFHDDVDGLGEEVEAEMLDELIDETVWDVLLNVGD